MREHDVELAAVLFDTNVAVPPVAVTARVRCRRQRWTSSGRAFGRALLDGLFRLGALLLRDGGIRRHPIGLRSAQIVIEYRIHDRGMRARLLLVGQHDDTHLQLRYQRRARDESRETSGVT